VAHEFTVGGRIARPVAEVFEAVADPRKLSGYFTTGGARGRLETGAVVTWDFHDFPGAFPVEVVEVVQNEKIVLCWESPTGDTTTVTMTFADTGDGRTLVRIHEAGWSETPAGEKAAFGNCEGWTGMLCALKVFVEHGLNLREGFYK
jgi:uncharacterized protein YndB with AHSA1/START domain